MLQNNYKIQDSMALVCMVCQMSDYLQKSERRNKMLMPL